MNSKEKAKLLMMLSLSMIATTKDNTESVKKNLFDTLLKVIKNDSIRPHSGPIALIPNSDSSTYILPLFIENYLSENDVADTLKIMTASLPGIKELIYMVDLSQLGERHPGNIVDYITDGILTDKSEGFLFISEDSKKRTVSFYDYIRGDEDIVVTDDPLTYSTTSNMVLKDTSIIHWILSLIQNEQL